jgi:hypothetical protein
VKTRLPCAVAALVLLAACVAKKEESAARPDVLFGVPALVGSQLLDTSGTAEAARVAFSVPMPPDTVAAAYRRYLPAHGWRLVGDVSDQGGTDLYFEREGPPLWIQVRPDGEGRSRYTLVGAVGKAAPNPDSAAAPAGRPAAPGDTAH